MKTESEIAADRYKRLIRKRTGLKSSELVCPREESEMTPCIARDGSLAVGDGYGGDVCVGCERGVLSLLAEEDKETHGERMNFCCECSKCHERWWCRGNDEPDTNSVELTGTMQVCPKCGTDDFEIVDSEYEGQD